MRRESLIFMVSAIFLINASQASAVFIAKDGKPILASADGPIAFTYESDQPEKQGIWTIDPITLDRRRLIEAQPGWILTQPAFSPDGRWLAYIRASNSQRQLAISDLLDRSSPPAIIASGVADLPLTDPAWKPDSKTITWSQAEHSSRRISIYSNNREGTAKRVLLPASTSGARDTYRFGFWADEQTLYVTHNDHPKTRPNKSYTNQSIVIKVDSQNKVISIEDSPVLPKGHSKEIVTPTGDHYSSGDRFKTLDLTRNSNLGRITEDGVKRYDISPTATSVAFTFRTKAPISTPGAVHSETGLWSFNLNTDKATELIPDAEDVAPAISWGHVIPQGIRNHNNNSITPPTNHSRTQKSNQSGPVPQKAPNATSGTMPESGVRTNALRIAAMVSGKNMLAITGSIKIPIPGSPSGCRGNVAYTLSIKGKPVITGSMVLRSSRRGCIFGKTLPLPRSSTRNAPTATLKITFKGSHGIPRSQRIQRIKLR